MGSDSGRSQGQAECSVPLRAAATRTEKGSSSPALHFCQALCCPPAGLLLSLLTDLISFPFGEMVSHFPRTSVALCESATVGAQHPG